MNNKRMQIVFALNMEAIEELGANWLNITFDICEYLKSKGFEYSRTLGFVNDRELTEEELREIGSEVVEIALGVENLLYFNATVIGNVMSIVPNEI